MVEKDMREQLDSHGLARKAQQLSPIGSKGGQAIQGKGFSLFESRSSAKFMASPENQ